MNELEGLTERPLQPHEQREEYITLGMTLLTSIMFLTSTILVGVLPENTLIHWIAIAVFFVFGVITVMLNIHYSKTAQPHAKDSDTMQHTLLPGDISPIRE